MRWWLQAWDATLHDLALCHFALAGLVLASITRQWFVVIFLSAVIGFGGLGAAWSRDTDDGKNWLSIAGAYHRPSRQVITCILEHGPFAVLSVALLYWRAT